MTPPPTADSSHSSASPHSNSIASHDTLPGSHADNNAVMQPKIQDDSGRQAFYALCAEQRRLVQQFLALEKPNKPETSLETLRAAQAQTRNSLEIIVKALRRFRLGALSLSYNGGKDCLVLLVLYLAALPEIYSPPNSDSAHADAKHASTSHSNHIEPSSATAKTISSTSQANGNTNHSIASHSPSSFPSALSAVYIEAPYPFPALSQFVEASAASYRLALVRHSGDAGLRAAFAAYCAAQPHVDAILVGTRRSDPHGAHLADFQETDRGWPVFVRVLPMLEWHYEEIWAFLRALDIPYCELYDQGYTSLGGTNDTHPNPALRIRDSELFAPAYELVGDAEERLGRDH